MNWRTIESKWQKRWVEAKIFEADPDQSRPKCFVTFPFPYMSGPLHVGHGYSCSRVDVYARYKRMCGYNMLFPWAWHWTGETVAGASERIKLGDEKFIKALKDVDEVPEEELKKFVDPAYMAKYYTDYNREAVIKFGLSVDWRREFHTTSLHPAFSRFVEWQYKKLRERNFVVQGTHPVVWCPKCESPTGEADRLEGEGVSPEEYALLKFRFEDTHLPAATLRPETIFGVTNLWINPEGTYVEALVNGEKWIVSKEAAEKLKNQLKKLEVLNEFKGSKLIGETCKEPIAGRGILILPGWFVNPKNASGVVYSVPAHAPYDWLALRDLKQNPKLLEEFGLSPNKVNDIEPISIIQVEEFGDYSAIEIAERMKIKDQNDPKLDEATKIIYKKEFHKGILKENCGGYAGRTIAEVKQQLIEDFKEKGIVNFIYELPQKVVCRCTTQCMVKILEDQWFLNYSNPEWKMKTKEALSRIQVYPKEARKWFEDVIDWLHDWPCARRTGLGTPLPWSPDWLIETLSDSTIYMAFYTINKYIKQVGVSPQKLTVEFFDYIFYGLGDVEQISKITGLTCEVLQSIRQEFLYWYPVDLRNSGKDLVPNHLTFYLFHHTALFPPEHWPKALGVNGFMKVEGEEMHKSKGNFIPLRKAIEDFGADITRCTVLLAAEAMDDPDWRASSLKEVKDNINSLYRYILEIRNLEGNDKAGQLEDWLISVLQHHIKKTSECIETLKTRTALENVLYEIWKDFRWYTRRVEKPHKQTILQTTKTWIKLLAPFLPHLTEELWEKIGGEGFISTASWPSYEEEKIDSKAEEVEELVRLTVEDTKNIFKATGIQPKKIYYYTAAEWKWDIYIGILEKLRKEVGSKDLIKEFTVQPEIRKMGSQAFIFIKKVVDEALKTPRDILDRRLKAGKIGEYMYLVDAKKFFEKEFNAAVYVFREDESGLFDPKNRARAAEPYRPAIYIE